MKLQMNYMMNTNINYWVIKMKGWYGNKYGHSLASRGIKSKYESNGHRIPFNQLKQAVLDKIHEYTEYYIEKGDDYEEIYLEHTNAFERVMASENVVDIQHGLVNSGLADNQYEASSMIYNALLEE